MNVKLLVGVLMTLIVCVSAAGCISSSDTAPYELAGTWVTSGNISIASYDLTLVCNGDGTAKLIGLLSSPTLSKDLNENLKWAYDQDNTFILSGGSTSIKVSMNGDTISLTINPKNMGIWDLDRDFDFTLNRLATSPDAIVGLWNGTIEGNVSNEIMLDFLEDGTGSISVIYYQGDIPTQEKKDITWEYVSVNAYQAKYGSNSASLKLYDDMLTIRIVPSVFIPGTSDSPITVVTKSFILPTPYIESPV
jgi:hypothetical protein